MSAHDPQGFELAAFKLFKQLQPDCKDSDLPLFLDNFKSELAKMKAYMEAKGSDERTAFEAVFCEPTTAQKPQENKIPLPSESDQGLQPKSFDELEPVEFSVEFLPDDEWLGVEIADDLLNFEEPYEPPKYTLSWNGIPFAPLGGIHALTGQSGHGKTQLFSQFMAAILNKSYGGLKYELSDSTPKPVVLYIDTEQEKANTIGVKNRVCEMIGWETQKARDDFFIVMLRETENAKDRWRKVLKSIFEVRPTIVFIDGLLDVVSDFNDNKECQNIIYRVMKVASHYQCSVWCLVHQNPGNTTKLVGHLGSMLERKVTDVFCCVKEKDDKTGEISFTVQQKKARGRDIPEWQFRVLPIGSYGRPEQIDNGKDIDRIEDIEKWLRDGRNDCQWPATKTQIKDIIRNRGGVGSNDRAFRDVEAAQKRRFIIEQPREEWSEKQKFPKYNLNID